VIELFRRKEYVFTVDARPGRDPMRSMAQIKEVPRAGPFDRAQVTAALGGPPWREDRGIRGSPRNPDLTRDICAHLPRAAAPGAAQSVRGTTASRCSCVH